MQAHTELDRAFYHLDLERQSPANPDLLNRVLQELGSDVTTTSLSLDEYQERMADRHLIAGIHPEKRDFDGIVVEEVSTTPDRKQRDVWSVLETMTDPDSGIRGNLATIFSYFEGRDDKQSKHWGGVLHLKQYFKDVRYHSNKKQAAIALWDVHSGATINILKKINGRKNKPEIVSLTAMPLFADELKKDKLLENGDTLVAAPDFGSFTKTRQMAKELGKPMIFIDKVRPKANHLIIKGIYLIKPDGKVEKIDKSYLEGKRVLFFDDMIDTGGTAVDLSKALKDLKVAEIVFTATHGVFSDRPKKKVKGEKSSMSIETALKKKIIDYIYATDSLSQYKKLNKFENVRTISLARPIAALIRIAANKAKSEDYNIVKRCLYNPGPDKNRIENHFSKRDVAPAFKNFDFQNAVFGNKSRVIFSRQPGLVA